MIGTTFEISSDGMDSNISGEKNDICQETRTQLTFPILLKFSISRFASVGSEALESRSAIVMKNWGAHGFRLMALSRPSMGFGETTGQSLPKARCAPGIAQGSPGKSMIPSGFRRYASTRRHFRSWSQQDEVAAWRQSHRAGQNGECLTGEAAQCARYGDGYREVHLSSGWLQIHPGSGGWQHHRWHVHGFAIPKTVT